MWAGASGRSVIALLAAALLGVPPPVTDLRATLTPQTGIAWHLTVPAVNDSACAPDSTGEVVCTLPSRRAPASDTVMYHYLVIGLPPPYQREFGDSAWVARGERISRSYQAWAVPWLREGVVTQHWLSRSAVWPMEPHRVESKRRSLYVFIRSYPGLAGD